MLMFGAHYEQGKLVQTLRVDEVDLNKVSDEGFIWLAFVRPRQADLAALSTYLPLHELAVEDAVKGTQRPKLEEYDEHLFMSLPLYDLQQVALSSSSALHLLQLEEGDMNLFVAKKFIVSVSHRHFFDLSAVKIRVEREPELIELGTGLVFYTLLDAAVDHYGPVVSYLEQEAENIDQLILEQPHLSRDRLLALYRLKQTVNRIKRNTYPLLEAVEKLHGGLVPQQVRHLSEYFRDVADHVQRFNHSIDFVRESVSSAIQLIFSLSAVEDAQVTKRLGAWAAIIAVPTLIAGVWGMNFEWMPELKVAWAYPLALSFMLGVSVFLYRHFKRLKWL